MLSIAKVDARANSEALYAFFAAHRFMGLHNARRVFQQAEPDLWFAHADETLVGALLSVEEERGGGGLRGCVENCLVTDLHRQRGVATLLLEEAEGHYRHRGLVGMEFAVRRELEVYDALRRSGYEVVRVYTKDKWDWEGNPILDQERHVIRKDFAERQRAPER